MNLVGVSGTLEFTLGIKPLGVLFFSIAVVSNSIWLLALFDDLASFVNALMLFCTVLS